MRLWDRVKAGWAGLFGSGEPIGSAGDRAYTGEQMKEYVSPQFYAGPHSPGLNLTGETWEMRQAYRRFAFREPSVKAPLLKKVYSVAALDPVVQPEDKNSRLDREAAVFVDAAFKGARGGWPRVLTDVMLMSHVDGFSLAHKKMKVADRGQFEGKWTLDEVVPKDTEHIRFHLDEYRRPLVIKSTAAGQAGVSFDPADFVLFTHLPIFRNPFGLSDLRAANRAANLIEAAIKLRSILLENFSGPFLKLVRSDASKMKQATEVLSRARAMGYIVLSPGDELEVLNLATSAPDQFQSAIEDLRKEAATAISGAYLLFTESKTPQGDTSEHSDVSEIFEWHLAEAVSACLTEQLVDDLIVPNFGKLVGRPTVKLGAVDVRKVLQECMRIEAAQNIGLEVSAEYGYEITGVEPPRHAGDVLKPPSKGGFGNPFADPNDPDGKPKLSPGAGEKGKGDPNGNGEGEE